LAQRSLVGIETIDEVRVPAEAHNLTVIGSNPTGVACSASIAEGDRVLTVGYPSVNSWRQNSGATLVSYQEEMRGSIGRVLRVDRTWDQDRKIWPTITVGADWKADMSGGFVFNENGEVVGIVSRGVNSGDESRPSISALWLEALPFSEDNQVNAFLLGSLTLRLEFGPAQSVPFGPQDGCKSCCP
jgi:hypothetical protein